VLYKSKIKEALPLDYAKELARGWDSTRLADWFDNKKRVYMPLVSKLSKDDNVTSGTELAIKDKVEPLGYTIKDYSNGILYNNKKNKEVDLAIILSKMDKNLLNAWTEEKALAKAKLIQPIVVISRHPYDIAGMTQDRSWWKTSCKDLNLPNIYGKGTHDGQFKDKIKNEINTMLIAYLIKPNDKNIQYPIARVLLVPYANKAGDIAFKVAGKVYGSADKLEQYFIQTVKEWLEVKQGNIADGTYRLNPNIYNDNFIDKFDVGQPDVADIDERWREVLSDVEDEALVEAIVKYLTDENIEPDKVTEVADHYAIMVYLGRNNKLTFYTPRQFNSIIDQQADEWADDQVYYRISELTGKYGDLEDLKYYVNFNALKDKLEEELMIPCSHCNSTGKDPDGNPDLFGGTADCLVCKGKGYNIPELDDNDEYDSENFQVTLSKFSDDELFDFVVNTLKWTPKNFTDLLDEDGIREYEKQAYKDNSDLWGERYEEIGRTKYWVENDY